ncbi:hypothetical protein FRC10_010028, partial [Ceratobasidium sp. 414]
MRKQVDKLDRCSDERPFQNNVEEQLRALQAEIRQTNNQIQVLSQHVANIDNPLSDMN